MRNSGRIGPGTSTLLLIVIILCLTMFGVLSLVNAKNEKNISDKVVVSTENYYIAQMEFQKYLEKIDEQLSLFRIENNNSDEYSKYIVENFTVNEDKQIEFSYRIDDARELYATIQICSLDEKQRYRIIDNYIRTDYSEEVEDDVWNLI